MAHTFYRLRCNFNTGEEAVELAAAEAAEMESGMASKLKAGKGWALRPFKTWWAALKDTIPEYTEPQPGTTPDGGRKAGPVR